MSEDLKESPKIVTIKDTFVVITTDSNEKFSENQPEKEHQKEPNESNNTEIQDSDKLNNADPKGDSIEIIESFENDIIIDPVEAVEKLNNGPQNLQDLTRNSRTDRNVVRTWIFPALFGSTRKNFLKPKVSGGDEASDYEINQEDDIFEPRTQPHYKLSVGRPKSLRDEDNAYEEVASYGSFVNERPDGPMYEPHIHNAYILLCLKYVFKMLCGTNIALFLVNNYIKYPRWMVKYLKVKALRKHFKRRGGFYYNAGLILYVIITYAFYCGPCTRHKLFGKIFLFLSVVSVTFVAMSLYVVDSCNDVVVSFLTTTVLTSVLMVLANRRFNFISSILYCFSAIITLISLIIFYFIGTKLLHNVSFPGFKAKFKLTLLCFYQTLAMIVQISLVLGHRALLYAQSEIYFTAFQMYSAFAQVFITIIEIMGIIEIEVE